MTATALALVACTDARTPLSPGENVLTNASIGTTSIRAEEADFFEVARNLPGFGGFFFDATGDMVVYLKDPALGTAAETALAPFLREHAQRPGRGMKENPAILVRRGEYEFTQLAAWRDQAVDPVLDVPGAAWVDADEVRNRLAIGVRDAAAQIAVERKLVELGIPLGAVVVDQDSEEAEYEEAPIVDSSTQPAPSTLWDDSGPMMGGMRIVWYNWSDGTWRRCTVNFATTYNSSPAAVTNSHCSTQEWKLEGTNYYWGSYRGSEAKDPSSDDNCGYLWLQKCRHADALIYDAGGAPTAQGYIARPRYWHTDSSTDPIYLEINPDKPTLQIIGTDDSKAGYVVDKIGASTGWTYASVEKTCVDTSTSVGHRYYCQHWSKYGRAGGDSGAPVFYWYGDTVAFLGTHWGKIWYNFEYYHVYSPDDRIFRDLGSLPVN